MVIACENPRLHGIANNGEISTFSRCNTAFDRSRFKSSEVLENINDELIRQFNATLTLQWKVYERAVELWDIRCREVLPASEHESLCTVPTPPERY